MDTVSFSLCSSEHFPPNSRFCATRICGFTRKFANFLSFEMTSSTDRWPLTRRFMFVHSVYFWLKPDLTEAQQVQFWAGVRALGTISSVRHCYIGTPAATDRPIIEDRKSVV